jgi:Fur family peroxide stress response transcriptional regulator
VYRNLRILVEQELITRIDFGSTFDRFEARTDPHYHFMCEKCGTIFDLDLPVDPSLNERVNRATRFTARSHRIQFFGTCGHCQQGR